MIAKRFLDLGMVLIIFLALLKFSSSLKGSKYFMLGQQLSTTVDYRRKPFVAFPNFTVARTNRLVRRKSGKNSELRLPRANEDYSKSEMALNCWLPMSWQDEKLKWNTSDYNGISRINILQHEIWLPDILAYSS
ncbi:unnamed protein product [Bemisia tabaci]|uniref:Neurotransmitter-gated ion-channel ligand-binding domain-containing protein n=1 Tax=Bemisia tabaci TaxID=7038 RepID=A0A9P0A2M7_BEMTA|nr:unnamed protein product [Bemisia tabaci]